MTREPDRYRPSGNYPQGAPPQPGRQFGRQRPAVPEEHTQIIYHPPVTTQDHEDSPPFSRSLARPEPLRSGRDVVPAPVSLQERLDKIALPSMIVLCVIETILLMFSLLPVSIASRLGFSSTNGPFPAALAPVVMTFYYLVPTATGFLARRWEFALFLATFPAWASIGIYSIASSTQNGIFSLTSGAHPSYLVGTLELYAILGGFGWIMRRAMLERPTRSAGE